MFEDEKPDLVLLLDFENTLHLPAGWNTLLLSQCGYYSQSYNVKSLILTSMSRHKWDEDSAWIVNHYIFSKYNVEPYIIFEDGLTKVKDDDFILLETDRKLFDKKEQSTYEWLAKFLHTKNLLLIDDDLRNRVAAQFSKNDLTSYAIDPADKLQVHEIGILIEKHAQQRQPE